MIAAGLMRAMARRPLWPLAIAGVTAAPVLLAAPALAGPRTGSAHRDGPDDHRKPGRADRGPGGHQLRERRVSRDRAAARRIQAAHRDPGRAGRERPAAPARLGGCSWPRGGRS